MSWTLTADHFEVKPVASPWPVAKSAWPVPSVGIPEASFKTDPVLKQRFAIALADQPAIDLKNAFKVGCEIFGADTNKALWVANNWLIDPEVLEIIKTCKEDCLQSQIPLDKDGFALKVLEYAEETALTPDGRKFYVNEAKDRLGFLKLYAEVKGYVGKVETNINNNTFVKEMKIKLVKVEDKQEIKTITPVSNSEIPNANGGVQVKLKLVG